MLQLLRQLPNGAYCLCVACCGAVICVQLVQQSSLIEMCKVDVKKPGFLPFSPACPHNLVNWDSDVRIWTLSTSKNTITFQ